MKTFQYLSGMFSFQFGIYLFRSGMIHTVPNYIHSGLTFFIVQIAASSSNEEIMNILLHLVNLKTLKML